MNSFELNFLDLIFEKNFEDINFVCKYEMVSHFMFVIESHKTTEPIYTNPEVTWTDCS